MHLMTTKSSFQICCALLCGYGIVEAHVCDIHPKSPREERMVEKENERRENEKNERTLDDSSSSESAKREAVESLVENERMV